jgi:hypothetical protein
LLSPSSRSRAASIGLVAALAAVHLLFLVPSAGASQPGTTASSTTSSTTSTVPATDCADAFAGPPRGSLDKAIVGLDQIAGVNLVQITTPRPPGTYRVVDCFKTRQITAVEVGDIRVSGSATFRVNIPESAVPGEETCDRVVLSGSADGRPFTDVSNEVCEIYSSCLFSPECPQNQPSPTRGVTSTAGRQPRSGTLPFTGVAEWPPLITAAALLGLGLASLLVARRRHG